MIPTPIAPRNVAPLHLIIKATIPGRTDAELRAALRRLPVGDRLRDAVEHEFLYRLDLRRLGPRGGGAP